MRPPGFWAAEVARFAGMSTAWVKELEAAGLLIPQRDDLGRRTYTLEDLTKARQIAVERRLRRKAAVVAG